MYILIIKYLALALFVGNVGMDNDSIGMDKEMSNDKEELHVVTFNIRYDNPNDGINRWEERIPIVKSYFSEERPDIIGMQEVLHNQLLDFQEILSEYSYVGTGRDDGETSGEYSPIFFRDDIRSLACCIYFKLLRIVLPSIQYTV